MEKEKVEFYSCPGDRYRPVYTPDVKKDGGIELVQTGVEDLQQYIDSFKDSCDVNLAVERFLAGDDTALSRGNPVFMDLLGAPKTLAEAYAINFRAEAAFENLPVKIREQFGNNFYTFLEQAGSDSWFEILKADKPVEEVEKVNEE